MCWLYCYWIGCNVQELSRKTIDTKCPISIQGSDIGMNLLMMNSILANGTQGGDVVVITLV